MLKALLALIMTSTLHASPMDTADFDYKVAWDTDPILSVQPLPQLDESIEAPVLTSTAAIAIDLDSGKILYERHSEEKKQIASLTKLMTGIIITEEETPYTVVKASANTTGVEGSTIFLNTDEEMTVKDLVYGMMIASGNDAAATLAEFNSGSVDNFVRKMNQKADLLGLTNSHFSNPMGFDSSENYSTARDMAILAMVAIDNEFLMEPVDLETYEAESVSGITHEYISTNKLLNTTLSSGVFVQGLKTGTTPEAGECLITLATTPENHRILTVVLDSEDRFGDTEVLINWLYANTTW